MIDGRTGQRRRRCVPLTCHSRIQHGKRNNERSCTDCKVGRRSLPGRQRHAAALRLVSTFCCGATNTLRMLCSRFCCEFGVTATAAAVTAPPCGSSLCPLCDVTALPSHRRRSRDSLGYSLLGAEAVAHRCPPEAEDELTISPYACYDASQGDRAPPIISGWLDKLSPQGCV